MADEFLQIDHDLRFQRREWVIERVAWTIMLIIVIFAMAGLFGNGLLSRASLKTGNAITIDYERFLHHSTSSSLKLRIRTAGDQPIRMKIDSGFVEAARIERIVPQPARAEIGDRWLTFYFPVGAAGAASIRIDFVPEIVGTLVGVFQIGASEPISITQFVYP